MTKWLAAGTGLLGVGLLKIWQHTNTPMTLQDYLAFRCGSATEVHGDSFLTFAGHCWGCPVAIVGAAMIVMSGVAAVTSSREPVRRAVFAGRR
jgi:Fe-S cluster biogenesis protein NfuA